MPDYLLTGDPDDPRFEEPTWQEIDYLREMTFEAWWDARYGPLECPQHGGGA